MEHHISKAKYEGYLWRSDQTSPDTFYGTEAMEQTLTDGENPFIVEGQLWDNEQQKSISIRYVDGEYKVSETQVAPEQQKQSAVSYIAHRIENVRKLKFLRIWEEAIDPLCEGMSTLRLKKTVFVGFKN